MIWKLISEIFTDTALHNNVNTKRKKQFSFSIYIANNYIHKKYPLFHGKLQSIEQTSPTRKTEIGSID